MAGRCILVDQWWWPEMAYPTTAVLDDFNRANENPLANGTWAGTIFSSGNACKLDTNQATAAGAFANSRWSVGTFGANCEVYLDLALLGDTVGILWRITNMGASVHGYEAFYYPAESVVRIYRIDDESTEVQLGADISQAYSVGDGLGIDMVGNTITLYRRASGVWSSVTTRSDSTYTGAGYIGFGVNIGGYADNFGGGTIVSGGTTTQKTLTDTLTASDSALDPTRRVRQMSDTVAVTDSVVQWRRLKRVMDETLTLADSVVKTLILAGSTTYTKVMSDTLTVTDAVIQWLRRVRGPIETVTLSDGDTYRTSIVTADEGLDLTDGFVSWRRLVRVAQDNIVLIDGFSKSLGGAGIVYAKVMSDVAILVDDAGQRWKLRVSQATDAVGLSDQVLDYLRAVRSLGDVVELVDGTVKVRRTIKSMDESIQISDDKVSTLYLDQMSNTSFSFGASGPPFRFGGM